MAKMKRLVKLEGFGNVVMAEAHISTPRPGEVLVKRSIAASSAVAPSCSGGT